MPRLNPEPMKPAGSGAFPPFEAPDPGRSAESRVQAVQRSHLKAVIAVPLLVGVGLFLHHYSLAVALSTAAVIALCWFGWLYLIGRRSRASLIGWPLGLTGLLLLAHLAADFLRHRLIPTVLLALLTLVLFQVFGARPLAFSRGSGPTPAENGASLDNASRPRIAWLAVLLLVAVYVPFVHSNTLAIAAILLLCVGFVLLAAGAAPRNPIRALIAACRQMRQARRLYLSESDDPAAPEPAALRRRTYHALTVPLVLTFTISLSFCCPWELFAHHFHPGFRWTPAIDRPVATFDWLTAPFSLLRTAQAGYLWTFVIGLPLLLLLPELVLFVVYLPAFSASQAAAEPQQPPKTATAQNEWEAHVDGIANSRRIVEEDERGRPLKTESEHLFYGLMPDSDQPVLLDRAILAEHVHIMGRSGGGKTALGMIPMLIQLIRGYQRPVCDAEGRPTGAWQPAPPSPILILDLKGDPALFHTTRIEAERCHREFLYFSADARRATYRFNPFQSLYAEPRTPIEVCELLIQALNLFHGEQYGASYYSRQHHDLLLGALADARSPVTSWQQLYDLIDNRYAGRQHRDATELLTVVHALTFFEQLSLTGKPETEPTIFMPDVLAKAQVVYFWLPSVLHNMSARNIAKLALYCFLTAAFDLRQRGQRIQSYVFIDEFQRIAAENVRVLFQQSRSSGTGLIVANQDPRDLVLPHVDVRAAVKTNARLCQYFSVRDDDEIDELIRLSGEQSQFLRTSVKTRSQVERYEPSLLLGDALIGTNLGQTAGEAFREVIRPRLSINQIIQVNNSDCDSIVYLIADSGLTRFHGIPTRIRGVYAMSRDEFLKRESDPFPTRPTPPQTIVPERSPEEVPDRGRNARGAFRRSRRGPRSVPRRLRRFHRPFPAARASYPTGPRRGAFGRNWRRPLAPRPAGSANSGRPSPRSRPSSRTPRACPCLGPARFPATDRPTWTRRCEAARPSARPGSPS